MVSKHTMKYKGFTLLYAVVVTSVILAASLSIISIALRELALSSSARDSQYAFYIANTGLECALYWDIVGTGDDEGVVVNARQEIFASPAPDGANIFTTAYAGSDPIECLGADIRNSEDVHYNTDALDIYPDQEWIIEDGVNPSITQFRISFTGTAAGACADVVVTKEDVDAGPAVDIRTVIESRGYNTCATSSRRVERGVELRY